MFEHFTQRSKDRKENDIACADPLQTPREIFMRKHISNS